MLGRFSKILVVDGSSESRKTTHRMLHGLGYENVEYAPDGGPALKLLGQNHYRLVLADWEMGPVSGLQLLNQMRADRRSNRMPFIMAVAPSQKKFVEIARDDGATVYLSRPFTADVLAERIAQVYANANKVTNVSPQTAQTRVPLSSGPGAALVPKLWQSLR